MSNKLKSIKFKSKGNKELNLPITISAEADFNSLCQQIDLNTHDYRIRPSYGYAEANLYLDEFGDLEVTSNLVDEITIKVDKVILNKIKLQFDDKLVNMKELYTLDKMTQAISENTDTIIQLDNVEVKFHSQSLIIAMKNKFEDYLYYINIKYPKQQ